MTTRRRPEPFCSPTPETRHQDRAHRADLHNMSADDDLCFNDLHRDTPVVARAPATMAEFLANGFPPGGGLHTLAALARLPDPGDRHAGMRQKLLNILEIQQRGSTCAAARSA